MLAAQVDLETPLPDLVRSLPPWSSLEDAELGSVIMYIRGCKNLQMPAEYRDVFPSHVDVGPSPQSRVVVNFS